MPVLPYRIAPGPLGERCSGANGASSRSAKQQVNWPGDPSRLRVEIPGMARPTLINASDSARPIVALAWWAGPRHPRPDATPPLVARGVSKSFTIPEEKVHTLKERVLHPGKGRGRHTFKALDNVSFAVRDGEFAQYLMFAKTL